jgi:hypothetical protein
MENQRQRIVVRRKNEEMALANKKLKELGVLDSEVTPKLSNRERSLAYAQSHKTAVRGSSALSIPDSHHMANHIEKTVSTLDQEIGKLLKVREAMALKNKQVHNYLWCGMLLIISSLYFDNSTPMFQNY